MFQSKFRLNKGNNQLIWKNHRETFEPRLLKAFQTNAYNQIKIINICNFLGGLTIGKRLEETKTFLLTFFRSHCFMYDSLHQKKKVENSNSHWQNKFYLKKTCLPFFIYLFFIHTVGKSLLDRLLAPGNSHRTYLTCIICGK